MAPEHQGLLLSQIFRKVQSSCLSLYL